MYLLSQKLYYSCDKSFTPLYNLSMQSSSFIPGLGLAVMTNLAKLERGHTNHLKILLGSSYLHLIWYLYHPSWPHGFEHYRLMYMYVSCMDDELPQIRFGLWKTNIVIQPFSYPKMTLIGILIESITFKVLGGVGSMLNTSSFLKSNY